MKAILLIKSFPLLAIGLFGTTVMQDKPSIHRVMSENYALTDPLYTTETLLASEATYGCNTMQVNVYATYPKGQVLLRHTAIIGTGDEYNNRDYLICSDRYDVKSGPEYIVKDEMLNGSIRDFFMRRIDIYRGFVMQKHKIMAIE